MAQRRGFREYLTGLLAPRDRNKTLTCLPAWRAGGLAPGRSPPSLARIRGRYPGRALPTGRSRARGRGHQSRGVRLRSRVTAVGTVVRRFHTFTPRARVRVRPDCQRGRRHRHHRLRPRRDGRRVRTARAARARADAPVQPVRGGETAGHHSFHPPPLPPTAPGPPPVKTNTRWLPSSGYREAGFVSTAAGPDGRMPWRGRVPAHSQAHRKRECVRRHGRSVVASRRTRPYPPSGRRSRRWNGTGGARTERLR